jgi:hypothetical protein
MSSVKRSKSLPENGRPFDWEAAAVEKGDDSAYLSVMDKWLKANWIYMRKTEFFKSRTQKSLRRDPLLTDTGNELEFEQG